MIFDRPLSAEEVAVLHVRQGGQPRLSIQPGNDVQLTWPLGAAAYHLEAATNLLSGAWDIATIAVISTPTGFTLPLSDGADTKFFRLHKP